MLQFHETIMGREFFANVQMQLNKLSKNLEQLRLLQEAQKPAKTEQYVLTIRGDNLSPLRKELEKGARVVTHFPVPEFSYICVILERDVSAS